MIPVKKPKKNKHGLDRYIPGPIAREIRQRCGFGCVVCGSSIYEYEHVDPEFKDAKKHDAACITLLCGSCHSNVTKGIWSKEKIKEHDKKPFCRKQGFSNAWFDYGIEVPTILVGGATIYQPDCVLRIFGQTLLELKGAEEPGAPIQISGVFFDKEGNLIFSIENNCWQGEIENWDIETVGSRITIRRRLRDIALVIRTEPRKALVVEYLDMFYEGVRVFANEQGVAFGPVDKDLYGFSGEIVNPVSAMEVLRNNGQEISCAVEIGTPSKGQFTNNSVWGADLALCVRGQDLILGIGYQAINVSGSLVCVPAKFTA